MSQLPKGWAEAPIVDLLSPLSDGRIIHQGWSPQCAQGASPNSDVWGVLKTTSIQNGRFLPEHNKLLPDALEPRNLLEVHEGDILLTCAGPRIRCGVPCLVRSTRPKLIISGKMYRMRAMEPYVESRFVEAMLRAPITQNAIDGIKTGMSESGMNLTHARFAKLEIPVPPTNEQKRIADKLDAVLARVDACRDRLDRIPTILKRFRQSVLAAATTGKLSRDWRAQLGERTCCVEVTDPYSHSVVAPDSWRMTSFGEVCELIGGSQPPKSTFVSEEADDVIRLIQIRDYKSDKFKVFIPRKLARRFCNATDVMIGRYGPPIFQASSVESVGDCSWFFNLEFHQGQTKGTERVFGMRRQKSPVPVQ